MIIRVRHLRDLTCTNPPHPCLYCDGCGARYSANRSDYWDSVPDHPFRCCGRPMRLVFIRESIVSAAEDRPVFTTDEEDN